METKRRKVASRSAGHLPSIATAANARTSKVDANLVSEEPTTVLSAVRKYKKELSTTEAVQSFLSTEADSFLALNRVFIKCARMDIVIE
ncbi:unnamed protein product [Toxocara canis]|nr:unnamed protein product [Toxocara canis]